MILSKLFKLLFITSVLILSGCMNSETPDPDTGGSGDFVVQEEKTSTFFLEPKDPENISPLGFSEDNFGLPNRKRYDFLVCIKDQATQRALPNFPFDVTDHLGKPVNKSTINLKTDPDGCLNWTEEIYYSPTKEEVRPSLFVRKIYGKGNVTGMRRFIFELFPWGKERGAFPEFRDITRRVDEVRKNKDCINSLESGESEGSCDSADAFMISSNDGKTRLSLDGVGYDLYNAGNFNIIPRGQERDASGKFISDAFKSDFVTQLDPEQIKMSLDTAEETSDYVSKPEKFAGMQMNLRLRMRVRREFKTADGSGVGYAPVNKGSFRVETYILSKNLTGSNPVLLTPNVLRTNQVIQDGLLNVEIKSILPYVPNAGRVLLALKLTPLDQSGQFQVIEDLYDIGPFDNLVGKTTPWRDSLAFNAEEAFDFDKYIASAINGVDIEDSGVLRENTPYQFSMFNIKFRTVEAGETAAKRTVIYTSEICITDERAARVGEGAEFEVYSLRYPIDYIDDGDDTNDLEGEDYTVVKLFKDEDGDRIKADAKGCIRFIDKMRHKYYKTERLVKRKVLIKRKNDENDNGTTLTVYINPWDEKFGTFGTDARAVSKTFLENLQNRKKIPSRFFIKDFGYETLRFRYEIDENMKLQVKKTVLFRTRPLVLRYSNILQGINSIHDLRDGIYLLKLAYQKDYLDPAASTRDTISKMREYGVAEDEIDPNNLPINRIGSPAVRTEEVDENGFPVYEYNENKPQLEIVDPIDGEFDPQDPSSGRVITDDRRARSERLLSEGPQSHLIESKYDPRKKQNLSIVKKLVRVNAGNIITPIEFSVDDLRLLRIRSQLFIQIEPVNQVRLQIVNMASELIEKSLVLRKGQSSEFNCLPEIDQQEIQQEKMRALDILAQEIDDDVYISSVEDLKEIFAKPAVVDAFEKFSNVGAFRNLSHIFNQITHKGSDVFDYKSIRDIDMETTAPIELDRIANISKKIESDNNFINQVKEFSSGLSNELREDFRTDFRVRSDDATLSYSGSETFDRFCRDTYQESEYEDCLESAIKEGFDQTESRNLCKCFDVVSQEFQPVEVDEAKEILDLKKKNAVAAFVSSLTGESALSDLLTNDFTLNGASSDLSDLDLLLDEYKSDDIRPRTFVGPLTFVKNSNSGSLRPTDNLDEGHCVTDDCNTADPVDRYGSIKNFTYERSKYHGSIAHFAGVQVDDFINGAILPNGDIIDSYAEYKRKKKNKENYNSLIYHFVEGMNLNFVSLKDETLFEPIENCFDVDKETGRCLVVNNNRVIDKNELLDQYVKNIMKTDEFTDEDKYRKLVANGFNHQTPCTKFDRFDCLQGPSLKNLRDLVVKEFPASDNPNYNGIVPVGYARFNQQERANMCGYLVYGSMAKHLYAELEKKDYQGRLSVVQLEKNADRKEVENTLVKILNSCVQQSENAISMERKYKINQTGRYYYLGGKSLNINLGQSTGISHSSSTSRNLSVSPSDIIQGLAKPFTGNGIAKDIFGSWSWSYSKGSSYSASAGTSINQGTFLVMQNAEFDVELTNYEQCVVTRWSEPMVRMYPKVFTGSLFDYGEEESEVLGRKLRSGFMICSGEEETEPIAIRETYYYFTQHFVEGDMQDRNDIHNHPWLLQLRGLREYETFLAAAKSDHVQAEKEDKRTVHAFELVKWSDMVKSDLQSVTRPSLSDEGYDKFDRLKKHSWPLTQLVRTYRRISPTFPGLYTQLDRAAYTSEQWPWDSEPGGALNETNAEQEGVCDGLNR